MSDVNKLMSDALQQLEEHKEWLKEQMHNHAVSETLIAQVDEIKLRMARIDAADDASILWEYPDDLTVFLRSGAAPEHLRKSLEGGRVVDMNQPSFSAKRLPS